MTEPIGLQWPLDAKGRRSSGAPGQRIMAAALHGLDAAAAEAAVAERDWRHAYPRLWRALVQAQAARPVGVVASARAKQLLQGCVPKVEPSGKPARTAQREVIEGYVQPVYDDEPAIDPQARPFA